jgi:hypothetical protein
MKIVRYMLLQKEQLKQYFLEIGKEKIQVSNNYMKNYYNPLVLKEMICKT